MQNLNWPELLIGGGIGFLSALLVASIYEWVRKPNLAFKIDENANEGKREIKNKDYEWKFLNIVVENPKRPWWQSWILGNVPVENARGWIYFRDFETKAELRKINARWATTRQPLNDFGRPDWSSLLVTSRESIPVGESSSLAICLKTSDSKNIYGFNNESYAFYPEYSAPYNTLWSKPDFEVGADKKYRICIKVLTGGYEYLKEFILLNPRTIYRSMRLVEVNPGEEC